MSFVQRLVGMFASRWPSRGDRPQRTPATDRLFERLSNARAAICERVFAANDRTEEETLAVGDALRHMVSASESHISETRSTLCELTDADNKSGMAGAIAEQTDLTASFLGDCKSELATQGEVLADAVTQAEQISAAVEKVEGITKFANLVAINTMIEAAKASAGGSFSVIAEEMKSLSSGVREANEQVGGLAEKLLACFGRLTRSSEEVRRLTEQFSDELQGKMDQVAEAGELMRKAFTELLNRGDERDANLLSALNDALRRLQFQDAMAQQLMLIDVELANLEAEASEILGVESPVPSRPSTVTAADSDRSRGGEIELF